MTRVVVRSATPREAAPARLVRSPSVSVPQRMTIVTLGARDLPMLRAFYRALGWQQNDGSDDTFTSFTLGGVRLALYPIDLLGAEAAPGEARVEQGSWNGVTLALNVSERDQVDQVFAAATQAGARAVGSPTERGWGRLFRLHRRPGGQPLGDRMGTVLRDLGVAPRCRLTSLTIRADLAHDPENEVVVLLEG